MRTSRCLPASDDLIVNGSQNAVLTGNGRNNYIIGSNGNDTINGGGGNVVIRAGTGSNMLTGGGQYDTFVFPSASDHGDTITDFHPDRDLIDLRAMFVSSGWSEASPFSHIAVAQQGANTILSVYPNGMSSPGHTLVTLDNVTASQMISGFNYVA